MKTILGMLFGFAISAALPGIALAQQKVTYDYAHTQDFSQLRTYAFGDSTKSDNPFVDERIKAEIARELGARGLVQVEANPDVFVTARQVYQTHPEYTAYADGPIGWGWGGYYGGWGWGYYGAGWGGYTTITVKDVTVRTLTVDLTDASTNELVWRGVARRTLHQMSKPKHVNKRINDDVEDMFEHYPVQAVLLRASD